MTVISSYNALRPYSSASLARGDVRSASTPRARIEATSPELRKFPFELSDGTVSVELDGEEPNWLYPILAKLREFSSMPQDWDSYGGLPTTFEAAFAALNFLAAYLRDEDVAPTLVPATSGGIQLEWHRLAGDLEVTFDAAGVFSAYFAGAAGDQEWEMESGSLDSQRLASAVQTVAGLAST